MHIHYTSRFVKAFKGLSEGIKKLAVQQEAIFRQHPNDPRLHIKALKGQLKGLLSFRVTRNYRVLFAWVVPYLLQQGDTVSVTESATYSVHSAQSGR